MPPQMIVIIIAYVGIMSTLATGLVLCSMWQSRRAVKAISQQLSEVVVFKQ